MIISKQDRPRNRKGGYKLVKISKLELVTLLLAAAFVAFAGGWFLRGGTSARPILVETERTLVPVQNTPVVLPPPTPSEKKMVNINTATAEELMELPGIGAKRAADIVAYREENGDFRIREDITKVSGIGESTLAGLIDFITTGE